MIRELLKRVRVLAVGRSKRVCNPKAEPTEVSDYLRVRVVWRRAIPFRIRMGSDMTQDGVQCSQGGGDPTTTPPPYQTATQPSQALWRLSDFVAREGSWSVRCGVCQRPMDRIQALIRLGEEVAEHSRRVLIG